MESASLHDALLGRLGAAYSAERQLIFAVPGLLATASDPELRRTVDDHLGETRMHLHRLKRIFTQLKEPIPREPVGRMSSLLADISRLSGATRNGATRDVALIAAMRPIERYEIVAYQAVLDLVRELDLREAEEILARTLDEERTADLDLSRLLLEERFQREGLPAEMIIRLSQGPARRARVAAPTGATTREGGRSRSRSD